jgi:hypothetical protein
MKSNTHKPEWGRWLIVIVFATAMAWVESAVVFYLRTHIDRIVPYQANPLPIIGGLGPVEAMRELATLIMLFTVGMLAGRTWRARWGYTFIAFGVWDIFYYVFLRVMCDWPRSVFDWDILFLIPLPWWGPVLAPVLISLLMIFWGTLASQIEKPQSSILATAGAWVLNVIGGTLVLLIFMADTMHAAVGGVDAIRNILPTSFNWPMFCLAFALMAAPVLLQLKHLWPRREVGIVAANQNTEVIRVN